MWDQALPPHQKATFLQREGRQRLTEAVIFSFLSVVSFGGDRGHMKTPSCLWLATSDCSSPLSDTRRSQSRERSQKMQDYVAMGGGGKSRPVPSQPFLCLGKRGACLLYFFFFILRSFCLASASAPGSQISSWSEAPELNISRSKLTLA